MEMLFNIVIGVIEVSAAVIAVTVAAGFIYYTIKTFKDD